MTIQNRLHSFVYSKAPGALVLQGHWGQGKTFFWRKRIADPFLADTRLNWRSRQYSYVSLFGIDSLSDLKIAIFQASEEADANGRSLWRRVFSIRWWWFLARRFASIVLDSGDIPYTAALSKTYNALAFYSIRNRLICLDDIERRGDHLALKDVMGQVAQLVEQRNCRVVVILNVGALGDSQGVWDKNKEKVFTGELTFNPTSSECIDLVLDGVAHTRWAPIARRRMLSLNITNIRIVQRVKMFIEATIEAAGERELLDETIDQIASVLVLLVYCHSGQGEGAPPIDMAMRITAMSEAIEDLDNKKIKKTEQEKKWAKILSDYGLYLGDEFDVALLEFVQAGYPDEALLREVIDRFETNVQRHRDKDRWHNAWRLYHDHVDENGPDILAEFQATWPAVSPRESANNLQWLVRLLRLLGRSDLATEYIQRWVDERKEDRSVELTPREYNRFDRVDDEELLAAINTGYMQNTVLPDLSAALRQIAENNRGVSEAMMAIAASTPEEIVKCLDSNSGPNLHEAIDNTLMLQARENTPSSLEAGEKMRAALHLIAKRSEFSSHRIKHKFNIE